MSSLKDSDEQTSPPATPGSRGVQVANSHFSKMSASRGNRGCLHNKCKNIFQNCRENIFEILSRNNIYILFYGPFGPAKWPSEE
jgi:hypothetical protein